MTAASLSTGRALAPDEVTTEERFTALEKRIATLEARGVVRRLGIREVEERVGLDETTIYRRYTATPPTFPPPVYFGSKRLWDVAAIEAWEAAQAATPRPQQSPRGVATWTKEQHEQREKAKRRKGRR